MCGAPKTCIGSAIDGGGFGNNTNPEDEAKRPTSCDFVNAAIGTDDEFAEFWPRYSEHSYCLFAPRFDIEYACKACMEKTCAVCNEVRPLFAYKECDVCGRTHCFNRSDMKVSPEGQIPSTSIVDLAVRGVQVLTDRGAGACRDYWHWWRYA